MNYRVPDQGGVWGCLPTRRQVDTLRSAFPEFLVSGYEQLIDSTTNDRKDRHVVAGAIVAGAQVIVTTNVRHFSGEHLSPYGIEVLTPDEFLTDLFDL